MPLLIAGPNRFLGRVAAASPWTPASISGLALWFKADALALNDGDAVTTWPDSSGNGYDLSQSTTAAKPTYKTAILNSLPVVRFDGGDVLNRDTTPLPLRTHSLFVVFRESSAVTSAGVFVMKPAAGDDYNRNDGIALDTYNNVGYLVVSAGTPTQYLTYVGSTGASPWGVYTHVLSASSGVLYYNGAAGAADSTFSTLNVNSAGGFLVGGRFLGGAISAGTRLNGDVAEILLYNTTLSSDDRLLVERHLGAKYGITVA